MSKCARLWWSWARCWVSSFIGKVHHSPSVLLWWLNKEKKSKCVSKKLFDKFISLDKSRWMFFNGLTLHNSLDDHIYWVSTQNFDRQSCDSLILDLESRLDDNVTIERKLMHIKLHHGESVLSFLDRIRYLIEDLTQPDNGKGGLRYNEGLREYWQPAWRWSHINNLCTSF